MNFLLIPDKFKGSLSAKEVINALTKGIRKADPKANIHSIIASDGGDGFLDAVAHCVKIEQVMTQTLDPLGRVLKAPYLYEKGSGQAYIELARASGMELLDPTERNPMNCSTLGTGIQIVHAMNRGAKSIYVGLGGSATNDGGTGIAKAMGYKFLNSDDRELQPLGKNLRQIERIELTEATRQLKEISLYAINDVNNPLYGEQGAAYVYATQKGAGEEEIVLLDEGLRQLDKVMQGQFNISIANEPGAGAAGGTAYGLKAFAKASFISGIDFMLQLAGVEDLLRKHPINYIITGEGRIDEQTLNGKLISGVVRLGKEHDIPVMAVCGKLEISRASLKDEGLYEVLEVREKTKSLEYNMENAFRLVEKSICEFFLNKL